MLFIFSGRPGTGKTTIARELARRLPAVHVRIDSIEQALHNAGVLRGSIDDAGYRVGYGVAEDNLGIGLTVTVNILVGGLVTGASMNPARSFGPALIQGHWDWHGFYWVGPIIGAVAAALLYHHVILERKPA